MMHLSQMPGPADLRHPTPLRPGGSAVRVPQALVALRPVIALGDLRTDQAIECPTQVFVHGDLTAGAGSEFDALPVQGALRLGARSAVRIWAHADGKVMLEQGCKVTRRVASMESVTQAPDGCFERVQAPGVNFGQAGQVRGVSNRRPRHQALSIKYLVVLQHLSVAFMPVLYICFGALFDMMVFVALYAWIVSLAPPLAPTRGAA